MTTWRHGHSHFAAVTIGLHWLMLLLIAAVYACIELREIYPKGSDPREALKAWHFTLGLGVLGLVSLRLLARLLAGPAPAIEPRPAAWQRWSAQALHVALYALMLGMPLAGWLILSASDKPIPFFGWTLPALIGPNDELAADIKELHEVSGQTGYFLIGLHAAAALFHHYIRRDNTLRRMLPGRG
jgi:superoxide oxidase